MKLCSITLTSNKESIIGDALLSVVDWVDCVIIIDLLDPSIPERDNTLKIAQEIAKDKLKVIPCVIGGNTVISELRNFALNAAYELGMDWACLIDTDERIIMNGVDIKATLGKIAPDIDTLLTRDSLNEYEKHRFFRLPAKHQFSAYTHEEWSEKNKFVILSHIQFLELPKTQEQLFNRLINSDLPNLEKQMKDDPTNYRWPYYLGATLETLQKYAEAISYYGKAMELVTHPPLRAWMYVRIALCNYRLQQFQASVFSCVLGLSEDPSYSELPWIAGMACHALGRLDNALQWEKIALVNSWIGKRYNELQRVGLKELSAFFEGPYVVMSTIYKDMNQPDLEKWAQEEARKALEDKEAFRKRL